MEQKPSPVQRFFKQVLIDDNQVQTQLNTDSSMVNKTEFEGHLEPKAPQPEEIYSFKIRSYC